MGCFLACLGSSKDKKGKRLHSNRIPSGARDQRRCYNPVEQVVYPEDSFKPAQRSASINDDAKPAQQAGSRSERESYAPNTSDAISQNNVVDDFIVGINEFLQHEASPKKSILASSPSSQCFRSKEKFADRSSSGAKKKVSFNEVVKTYEPVSSFELLNMEDFSNDEKTVKPNKSNSDSETGSKTSSCGSYLPNHRYQNCRESDDDDEEEFYDEESDIDINDSELEEDEYSDVDTLNDSLSSMESTTRVLPDGKKSPEEKRIDSNLITRGRDGYDQLVLNPVENLSQWKALKAMGKKPQLQTLHKENCAVDIKGRPEQQAQQMAVDASLSNWLIAPEQISKPKTNAITTYNVMQQQTTWQGSYSSGSFDDRPILGAMTVEELKLLSSRTSSPRKSPSKSPDDMAIIGSVGSYWNPEKSDKDSPKDSSGRRRNPSTTSKYPEDMRVKWDSTPFETRLEKALEQGSAEA